MIMIAACIFGLLVALTFCQALAENRLAFFLQFRFLGSVLPEFFLVIPGAIVLRLVACLDAFTYQALFLAILGALIVVVAAISRHRRLSESPKADEAETNDKNIPHFYKSCWIVNMISRATWSPFAKPEPIMAKKSRHRFVRSEDVAGEC
jgi:hypothetical protein